MTRRGVNESLRSCLLFPLVLQATWQAKKKQKKTSGEIRPRSVPIKQLTAAPNPLVLMTIFADNYLFLEKLSADMI